jgi:hypothetical protein
LSEVDLTTALGRLLTDRKLRQIFLHDQLQCARLISIRNTDKEAFIALDPVGLEVQAHTLLRKRLHEVSRLLTKTFELLGAQAEKLFFAYAQTFWPEHHTRHLEDAVFFCRYLIRQGRRELYRPEYNRLRFVLEERKLSIHFVRKIWIRRKLCPAVQILQRSQNGRRREVVLAFFQ